MEPETPAFTARVDITEDEVPGATDESGDDASVARVSTNGTLGVAGWSKVTGTSLVFSVSSVLVFRLDARVLVVEAARALDGGTTRNQPGELPGARVAALTGVTGAVTGPSVTPVVGPSQVRHASPFLAEGAGALSVSASM
ncbi:MAG: hypothetical protein LC775_03765 [Acidobacteria bacterium]|nr:hypothetical protein [Acidobacteriota bacterium]